MAGRTINLQIKEPSGNYFDADWEGHDVYTAYFESAEEIDAMAWGREDAKRIALAAAARDYSRSIGKLVRVVGPRVGYFF